MEMNEKSLKLIVIGEPGCGKTSLTIRYVNRVVPNHTTSTIGVDYFRRRIKLGEEYVTLQIWDSAGQELNKSLTRNFSRNCHACILVFDLCVRETFEGLLDWEDYMLNSLPGNKLALPFVIIGNKCDKSGRKVTREEAEEYCLSRGGFPYFESSAMENINVDELFQEAAQCALINYDGDNSVRRDWVRLRNVSEKKERQGCRC